LTTFQEFLTPETKNHRKGLFKAFQNLQENLKSAQNFSQNVKMIIGFSDFKLLKILKISVNCLAFDIFL